MWTVYLLRVEGDELPFYVGCTSRSAERRWIEHKHRALKGLENIERGRYIVAALAAGRNVLVEVLETHETKEEAHLREVYWIAHYGRQPEGPLLNTDAGGTGVGKVLSASARQKMSQAKMGHKINVGRPRPDFREKTRKDITAFKITGERVGSYETARLASEATGVCWKMISQVARGTTKATKSINGDVYHFKFGIIEHDIEPIKYRSQLSRRK